MSLRIWYWPLSRTIKINTALQTAIMCDQSGRLTKQTSSLSLHCSFILQYSTNQQNTGCTLNFVLWMQALYKPSRKRHEEDGKIKGKPTVPTSISNTVAHAALFKPDAGLWEWREGDVEWCGEVRPGRGERLSERNVVWVKQHEETVA